MGAQLPVASRGSTSKATSLQNKAIKILGLLCSESVFTWSQLQQFDRIVKKARVCLKRWKDLLKFNQQLEKKLFLLSNLTWSWPSPWFWVSSVRLLPSLPPYGRNWQTLAPRAPNLLCDRELSLGEFPFHHHRLSAPGNTSTYTPSTRSLIKLTTGLLLLFGKAMGLWGGPVQSMLREKHARSPSPVGVEFKDTPPSFPLI